MDFGVPYVQTKPYLLSQHRSFKGPPLIVELPLFNGVVPLEHGVCSQLLFFAPNLATCIHVRIVQCQTFKVNTYSNPKTMLENIGKHRLTIPEALFLSFYIGLTICHMLYLGVAILLIQPQARLPVHRVAVESRQGFTAHGDGLHLGQFSPCPVDRWTDLGWKKKGKRTRRRMARERRGAGSSLVSMETQYYKTIY